MSQKNKQRYVDAAQMEQERDLYKTYLKNRLGGNVELG